MKNESNRRVVMMQIAPRQQADEAVDVEDSLYAVRKKIYPRAVTGLFARWRWALVWITQLVFYGFPWLVWNERQAVLFDLVQRKFYIFGLVFWPQDVLFLAVLLIICAFALFLFTAVAGRLWCGYACPQTVYTEIFMWLEAKFEGDHGARRKLDAAPWNLEKLWRRGGKESSWTLLSAWTGFTFVGFFTPIHELWSGVWNFQLGGWETFWLLFYSSFTYLFAGHLREQVCTYMCPYARFQGVMFDPDTLVITYDTDRGEPRGPRKKSVDPRSVGKGDCVDCGICVQVCPTGIDIRNGLQHECIGCAACIDACDQVMDKVGYPRGLIRYSTENAVQQHWGWNEIMGHVARPRILIYTALLGVLCIAFVWGLATKPALRVDVIRDRATLAREVEAGWVENVYSLHVMNVTERPRRFGAAVSGLAGAKLIGFNRIELAAGGARTVTVQVRIPPGIGVKGANTIHFLVFAEDDAQVATKEKASFLLP